MGWLSCAPCGALVLVLVLAAASATAPAGAEAVLVQGGGSSFATRVQEGWTSAFNQFRNGESVVSYTASSSVSGRAALLDGLLAYCGSDDDLLPQELASTNSSDIIAFPTFGGAVVVGYNLPTVPSAVTLSQMTLAMIFDGRIQYWNDSHIQEDNQRTEFPPARISVVVRSDSSGTSDAFTRALGLFDPAGFAVTVPHSTLPNWPPSVRNLTANQNTGMSLLILSTPFSIGYLNPSEARFYGVGEAKVQNSAGVAVLATTGTVQSAMADFDSRFTETDGRMIVDIMNAPSPSSYPIASLTYMMLHSSSMRDLPQAVELVRFARWFLSTTDSDTVVVGAGMCPLSVEVKQRIMLQLQTVTVAGTAVYPLSSYPLAKSLASSQSRSMDGVVIASATLAGSCLLIIVVAGLYFYLRRKKFMQLRDSEAEEAPDGQVALLVAKLDEPDALWRDDPVSFRRILDVFYDLAVGLLQTHQGFLVRKESHGLFAVFESAADAVRWCLEVQEWLCSPDSLRMCTQSAHRPTNWHRWRIGRRRRMAPNVRLSTLSASLAACEALLRRIVVSAGIHVGRCTKEIARSDVGVAVADYSGVAVLDAVDVGRLAVGGRIVVSAPAWEDLTLRYQESGLERDIEASDLCELQLRGHALPVSLVVASRCVPAAAPISPASSTLSLGTVSESKSAPTAKSIELKLVGMDGRTARVVHSNDSAHVEGKLLQDACGQD